MRPQLEAASGDARPDRRRRGGVLVAMALALTAALAPAPASAGTPGATAPSGRALKVPLLSARRVPDMLTSPMADERLRQQVEGIAARAPAESCIAVLAGGRPVVRVKADAPLEPASVMKLVTATALFRHAKPD